MHRNDNGEPYAFFIIFYTRPKPRAGRTGQSHIQYENALPVYIKRLLNLYDP